MRILITGGTGFVGRYVASALRSPDNSVYVASRRGGPIEGCHTVQADLLQPETALALLEEVRPEIVVHLAWYVESGKFWNAKENLDWTSATLRLLAAAQKVGVRRLVCAGTCWEYDLSTSTPYNEHRTPIVPTTIYAISKDATRRLVESFAAANGIEFAWARVFYLFGPGEHFSRLVPSVILNLIAGKSASLSTGEQIRDFMDVRDAGMAIAALATSSVQGPVNIASGNGITIADIAKELLNIIGGPGEILLGKIESRAGDPPFIVADVERLHREVGYQPSLKLDNRLRETVEWWQSHQVGAD